MSEIQTLLSDSVGAYIPFRFCWELAPRWDGIDLDDLAICQAGPCHPEYWDAWISILNSATFTDSAGDVWRLQQEGDLMAYTGDGEEFVCG
jgi:hypothetical protein